jgi:hypothetical protein
MRQFGTAALQKMTVHNRWTLTLSLSLSLSLSLA